MGPLHVALGGHPPGDEAEARSLGRLLALVGDGRDPWSRAEPLHLTGSALVVHPPSRRVLLHWHAKHGGWLQLGGHAEPGEGDPAEVARREAVEESGLDDLVPWPDPAVPRLLHVVVVSVAASGGEPAHEHGDLRYVLATAKPEEARPEPGGGELRWSTLDEARDLAGDASLAASLARVAEVLGGRSAGALRRPPGV